MEHRTPHIAILPSLGMGHLIPLTELARKLVNQHDISITLLIPTNGPPSKAIKSLLSPLPPSLDAMFLPPADLQSEEDMQMETLISLKMARSLPSLKQVLSSLVTSKRLVALVVDLFGTDAIDVAREFNVSAYLFFTTTAKCLSFLLYLPKLDETVSCEYWELEEPVSIPGCMPLHGKDFAEPVKDRKDDAYKWVLHLSSRLVLADGIMLNSFMDMEKVTIRYLQEEWPGLPPVYPVGPLVNMGKTSESDECLAWLDKQPVGSVIFVSFGSGGTLSYSQVIELALGLEMSGHRFLWVVRKPNDEIAVPDYLRSDDQNEDSFSFLPSGFTERTKERSMVLPSWAPQTQVLSHGSTGGFLTHCGWNSILESVVNGVPLIAWPLYAEQRMNAEMLTKEIKVALRPKANENGLIEKEEIANIVKCLMEGEEGMAVRNKMKELKEEASKALSEDGSSAKALSAVVQKWKNFNQNYN